MNEVKSLEAELRSWALRQPSAKVKQHLFSPEANHVVVPEPARSQKVPLWSFLAPVAACLFVATAALHQRENLFPSGSERVMGTLMTSNCNVAVSSSNTFDWTNRPEIPTSVRSQSVLGTNH